MASTDYTNTSLTIIDMVRFRLPFLSTSPEVQAQIRAFILEVMEDLEPCLRVSQVDWNNTQNDPTNATPPWPVIPSPGKVGREQYYTIPMMGMIADLVAVQILMQIAAENANGGTDGSSVSGTYMKKAKADVVEVEWGLATGVDRLSLATDKLIDLYHSSAKIKALKFGCVLEVCDPCTDDGAGRPTPFVIIRDCGCKA